MIREIVTDVRELAKLSLPIHTTSPEEGMIVDAVVADLIDTAEHHRLTKIGCLGLAANQIGYHVRVIVIWEGNHWQLMVNPSWHPRDGKQGSSHEQCLSRPSVNAKVKRHKRIECSWEDPTDVLPDRRSAKYAHLTARIIQHEVDHLDGKFINN